VSSQKVPVEISGSRRTILRGAKESEPADPNERIEVTLIVRRRASLPKAAEELGVEQIAKRSHLDRETFRARHGTAPDDLVKVEAFAQEQGLEVVRADSARRTVILAGTANQLSKAFGVRLARYDHPDGSYRGRTGPIFIPKELASIVLAVLGLDNRPQAKPHFRMSPNRATSTSYTPPQVARLYDFPTSLDGSNQCIGIIELGGGSDPSDLATYFQAVGIPEPDIISIPIDGASNNPIGDANSNGEVMLDIEVAGSIAPKARIAVYYAPNNDRGFLDAVTTAIHDDTNKPSVISISWGGAEDKWIQQATQAFDEAFQEAATLGVTICAASGDNGSSDGEADGLAHVDFPASSSYVLACGGTHLESQGDLITEESVWNEQSTGGGATGGGVSDVFSLPQWQTNGRVPPSKNPPGTHIGRGVPDVSGDADPETGYSVRANGQDTVIGGTSAVAPLWAALLALINQQNGTPVGYLNPLLYTLPAGNTAFHDVTKGDNGDYHAAGGWDPCTGLGTPDGSNLLNKLLAKVMAPLAA